MRYHVLIAEDEAVTREAVRAGLSVVLPGSEIHAVKNGVEAVAYAIERKIDIAFLDIRMPEMNGLCAAQKIRQMQKDCQLVFLTAYDDFEYVRSALKLDAVDYLLKPFDGGTLSDTVQKVRKRMEHTADPHAGEAGPKRLEYDERSRWLDELELKALLGGRLAPALIPPGSCGCVAVVRGPDDTQMQRLKHVLTGLDLGGDIRCLIGKTGGIWVIAAWSTAQETLQEQIKKPMDMLAARLKRQFGVQLRCGISGLFLDDGDISEACLDAYCQLWLGTGREQVRVSDHVMQGDLMDAMRDAVLSGMALSDAGRTDAALSDTNASGWDRDVMVLCGILRSFQDIAGIGADSSEQEVQLWLKAIRDEQRKEEQ